jgi:tetratricopeptide (TPR) repeat protein
LAEQGRLSEAAELLRLCLASQRRVLGAKELSTLETMSALSWCLASQGKFSEAEPLAQDCLRLSVDSLPKNHPFLIIRGGRYALLLVLLYEGKALEMESLARKNLEAASGVWGPNDGRTGECANIVAYALYLRGRFQEAEQQIRHSLKTLLQIYGPDDARVGWGWYVLGLVCRATGRWEEAGTMFGKAWKQQSQQRP